MARTSPALIIGATVAGLGILALAVSKPSAASRPAPRPDPGPRPTPLPRPQPGPAPTPAPAPAPAPGEDNAVQASIYVYEGYHLDPLSSEPGYNWHEPLEYNKLPEGVLADYRKGNTLVLWSGLPELLEEARAVLEPYGYVIDRQREQAVIWEPPRPVPNPMQIPTFGSDPVFAFEMLTPAAAEVKVATFVTAEPPPLFVEDGFITTVIRDGKYIGIAVKKGTPSVQESFYPYFDDLPGLVAVSPVVDAELFYVPRD